MRMRASGYPQGADKSGGLSTGWDRGWRPANGNRHAWSMAVEIPAGCRELLAQQGGVLRRSQAAQFELSLSAMRHRLQAADWQRVHRGVYAAFSGELTREAQLWAALVRTGPGAVLSHQTAAELYGLTKQLSALIHVTVPATTNPAQYGRIPGVVVHRSRILERTRHPALLPPRTRVEDTVLDLIEGMDEPGDRYDLICRAIGSRLTTAGDCGWPWGSGDGSTIGGRRSWPWPTRGRGRCRTWSGGICEGSSGGISFRRQRDRRAERSTVKAFTWTTSMRRIWCALNWTGVPLIRRASNGAINGGTGATWRPGKLSRCALGMRICAPSRRNARRRGKSPASCASGGRGRAFPAGWPGAVVSAGG